jgi:hypothetical protein
MQSRINVRRQTIHLTGATVEDARRAEGWSARWKRNADGRVAPKGRTRYFLFQPSLPLIQATLVRGAFGAQTPGASRLPYFALAFSPVFRFIPLPQYPDFLYSLIFTTSLPSQHIERRPPTIPGLGAGIAFFRTQRRSVLGSIPKNLLTPEIE